MPACHFLSLAKGLHPLSESDFGAREPKVPGVGWETTPLSLISSFSPEKVGLALICFHLVILQ